MRYLSFTSARFLIKNWVLQVVSTFSLPSLVHFRRPSPSTGVPCDGAQALGPRQPQGFHPQIHSTSKSRMKILASQEENMLLSLKPSSPPFSPQSAPDYKH